jgi:hypothetical protein
MIFNKTNKLLPVLLLITGCQTCQQHPVACGVAAGVVTYSLENSFNKGKTVTMQSKQSIQPITNGDTK